MRAEKDDELSSAMPEVSPVVFKWTVGASSSSWTLSIDETEREKMVV